MRVLHCVESYYPFVSGASEVVRQLSERMVKAGHQVTVATRKLPERKAKTHNGVRIVEFDIKPASTKSASIATGLIGETKKYQDFLKNGDFDIIMTYAAQQWTTDLMFEIMDNIKAKKILVPCGFSALHDPVFKGYFAKLPAYLKKFDACVYLSDDYRDIDFARQHKLANSHLIPNGADELEFEPPLPKARRAELQKKYGLRGLVLISVGNITGEKGHQELLWVFKRLPLPRVTLVAASSKMPGIGWYDEFERQAKRINTSRKFPGKRVVLIDGTKRKEVVDLMKASDMFVFFSNIEASPLVLFEANAAGLPFVASNAGNSAEIAKWTGGGVIVKSHPKAEGRVGVDLKDALWKVTRLGLNLVLRRRLGRRGRQAWQAKFTWEKLTKDYLKLYEDLLQKGPR